MKKILFTGYILCLWLMAPVTVIEASWLIDFKRFSASVHGETSCQDCHPDFSRDRLHPDPHQVGKGLSDFFTADQCLTCHDGVQDNLKEGTHGSLKIDSPQKYEACLRCHDPHYQLPIGRKSAEKAATDPASLSEQDQACMACHGLNPKDDPEKIKAFCFHCHARSGTRTQELTAQIIPLIDPASYPSVTHAKVACLTCHPAAAAFNHDVQLPGNCRECHPPHHERVAHDAHVLVACQACHLNNVTASRDPRTQKVLPQKQRILGTPLTIHAMQREDSQAMCRRCHTVANEVGAAAAILPAKSIMCMPCHAATFSVGDTVSIVALLIFVGGLILFFAFVLTGAPAGKEAGVVQKTFGLITDILTAVFSAKILTIIKTLFIDVLLQRRLYQKSAGRWLIHSFIFLSIVFRFCWGFGALLLSLLKPEWPTVWALLDKNHPAAAFLFDLSGILILLGVILAFIRGVQRKISLPPNLPGQDRTALGLIGGIVIVGFILEGMRIAMTGWPPGSVHAFAGYALSRLFAGASGLTEAYGYVWYLHAAVTGMFVAYLPFSRLIHMILAPFTLAMSALSESEHAKKA